MPEQIRDDSKREAIIETLMAMKRKLGMLSGEISGFGRVYKA